MVGALGRVLEQVGRPRRVGLVVPDPVAKVSLVQFRAGAAARAGPRSADSLAGAEGGAVSDRGGAGQLRRRARVRRTGQEFVVSLARRDIIEEYEGAVRGGRRARRARRSLDVQCHQRRARRQPAPPAGDWLLVNVAPDWASIAILRGPHLIFFRSRGADARRHAGRSRAPDGDVLRGPPAGRGLRRACCCAAPPAPAPQQAGDVEQVRRSLEERLATPVETVDPRAAAADRSDRRRRRRCSTRWRRSSACCCADREAAA